MQIQNDKISIAPMLDWTDRHYRYFMRHITRKTSLYTEMIVADAIIHGNTDHLLSFDNKEQPLIVQLGGSDPAKLVLAAKKCRDYGYQEINLNIGCPSERVQSGSFGACLMREPELVADCLQAIQNTVAIPVSIKHRIGLDYEYNYAYLQQFVSILQEAGCEKFIVHARNAVLKGLSPKENREVPPLRYDFVYQLKKDFPNLTIQINGGIKTNQEISTHLNHVDGVMIGREAYYNPFLLADFDERYFGLAPSVITRKNVAISMLPYLEKILQKNGKLHHATRHMIGLYYATRQAKLWRQTLTTKIIQTNSLDDYYNLIEQMDE